MHIRVSKTTVLVLIVLILAVLGAYLYYRHNQSQVPESTLQDLTREQALSLLQSQLATECKQEGVADTYRSCAVDIAASGSGLTVKVTYEGLYDDSVGAEQVVARIEYRDSLWTLIDFQRLQRCQPGRGHQEFSAEPCV